MKPKYDVYLRGHFLRTVTGSCPVEALHVAHGIVGGDVQNGRLVVIRSYLRGQCVTDARVQSMSSEEQQ